MCVLFRTSNVLITCAAMLSYENLIRPYAPLLFWIINTQTVNCYMKLCLSPLNFDTCLVVMLENITKTSYPCIDKTTMWYRKLSYVVYLFNPHSTTKGIKRITPRIMNRWLKWINHWCYLIIPNATLHTYSNRSTL